MQDHVIGGELAETEEVSSLCMEAFAVRILDALQTDGRAVIGQHDGVRLIGSGI
ncbi:hypothetical protein AB0C18_03600 [Nonomuraea muscovyensis]|uniref:hypothetical protein n=1 Tax=Nonomuraea muscovyensis TaxID=1124761 RepID=UPI0033D408C4